MEFPHTSFKRTYDSCKIIRPCSLHGGHVPTHETTDNWMASRDLTFVCKVEAGWDPTPPRRLVRASLGINQSKVQDEILITTEQPASLPFQILVPTDSTYTRLLRSYGAMPLKEPVSLHKSG